MTKLSEETFLVQLERQAAVQARLENERFLPRQLDGMTAYIGRHSWKVFLAASFATAVVLEIW